MAISATHMMTILMRIKHNQPTLLLSPNALLNNADNGINIETLESRLQSGIEERYYYEPLPLQVRDFEYCTDGSRRRFNIIRFKYYQEPYEIIHFLKQNFEPEGRRYPVLALCHPSELMGNNELAAQTSIRNPYHWGNRHHADDYYPNGIVVDPLGYAVLVTGLYTIADNLGVYGYSVEIKNSTGPNWGHGGRAWVTADLFVRICIPVLSGEEPLDDFNLRYVRRP